MFCRRNIELIYVGCRPGAQMLSTGGEKHERTEQHLVSVVVDVTWIHAKAVAKVHNHTAEQSAKWMQQHPPVASQARTLL